jgi:hypothetical protein
MEIDLFFIFSPLKCPALQFEIDILNADHLHPKTKKTAEGKLSFGSLAVCMAHRSMTLRVHLTVELPFRERTSMNALILSSRPMKYTSIMFIRIG